MNKKDLQNKKTPNSLKSKTKDLKRKSIKKRDLAPIPSKGNLLPAVREETKSLVPLDPLSIYLREVRAYPPLSKEEETDLAIRYYEKKDIDAAYMLVSSNLWLVVKLAREYQKAAKNIMDLIQEGNIGLMEAVKNFNPYRGVRFPSYAVWWVKAYIIRWMIANWRMVKIGTTQAQRKLFFNLQKEKERLEKEGLFPAPKLIADRLQVKEHEVIEMEQRLGGSDVSVDSPVHADTDSSYLSILPADQLNAEEMVSEKQTKELVDKGFKEFSSTLNAKEKVIFNERMLNEEKATLQVLSDKLGISRERVRQIENKILKNLKDFFATKYGSEINYGTRSRKQKVN